MPSTFTQAKGLHWPIRIAPAVLLIGLVLFGSQAGNYHLNVGVVTFLMIVLAISMRLLMVAGEAALCWGAFYALGAYCTGILTTQQGISFWLTVPLGGLVASLGALVIGLPSLRTTGAYFLLMTFGFMIVLGSLLGVWQSLTGGFSGIQAIPRPDGIESLSSWYWVTLTLAVLVFLIFRQIDASRWGLQLRALGQSRELAQSVGMAPGPHILLAFIVGAFFAGIAGSFYASYVTFISPTSFTFWISVNVLMYVILGGSRYLWGAIVGTIVLQIIPVVLNWSERFVVIATAVATLAILMLMPKGIVTVVVDRLPGLSKGFALRRPSLSEVSKLDRDADGAPAGGAAPEDLSIREVSKRFGGLQALDGVSFKVRSGETLGIIGPNGAGKTTLFNIISGFQKPDSGTVQMGQDSLVGIGPTAIVERGLTRTFQHTSVFDELTVFENLLVATRDRSESNHISNLLGHLRSTRRDRGALVRAERLVQRFRLGEWAEARAEDLPYGVRKRLGVAIGLATNPTFIFLDEPMAGLADTEVQEMTRLLTEIREASDVTIVIIEHRMAAVTQLCDRLVVLDFGKIIADGPVNQVMSDPLVVEAYLGGADEVVERV